MTIHNMTIGPLADIIIIDDTVDDFISVDTAGANVIFLADGSIISAPDSEVFLTTLLPWADNELGRWHGASPGAAVFQGSSVFVDDLQNMTGLNDVTMAGVIRTDKIGLANGSDDDLLELVSGELDINGDLLVIGSIFGNDIQADPWIGANGEEISNAIDGQITFTGTGGADNTDLAFDLDGTRPRIFSPTDGAIEISESLFITGNLDVQGGTIGNSSIADLTLMTNGVANQLVLDSGGSVGIGTATPGAKLEVVGDTLISTGDLKVPDGGASFGRDLITGIRVVIEEDNTQVSDMLRIAQKSTGDAALGFALITGTDWIMGIDNSDGDKFKIGQGVADVGQFPALSIDTSRNIEVVDGDFTIVLGDFRVVAGDSAFGRPVIAGVRVAIQENSTQTSDILRLVQQGIGDASIGFVTVSGTGTDWIMGVDNTNGSFGLGLGIVNVAQFPALVIDASRNVDISVGNFNVLDGNASINGLLILPKDSASGIKVDIASPTYGFADFIGDQFANNTGATKPSLTTYNGAVTSWQFGVGDEAFMSFHISHDYVIGTDIFLHIHWSHTGGLVTGGTVTFKITSIYAKGHDQASFTSSPAVGTFVGTVSTTTQYRHMLTEVQYSDSAPTGLEVDTDLLEPDGVIEMTFELDANDITVSGGLVPDPFIHFVDIHYQTTGLIGTKAKAPDFYV